MRGNLIGFFILSAEIGIRLEELNIAERDLARFVHHMPKPSTFTSAWGIDHAHDVAVTQDAADDFEKPPARDAIEPAHLYALSH